MRIAIASGKGGTGKTTVAVNLALALGSAQLLDCDVEEPNCNLFLGFGLEKQEDVLISFPEIDKDKCTLCGRCADICQFNAIAALPKSVMVFPKLCHGCGGCSLVCPDGAISEAARSIGMIERGIDESFNIELFQGTLDISEPMASPVIRQLQEHIDDSTVAIIDSPPGTACPVIASVAEMDYCVLVTEPTPFGLNDLVLAVAVVKQLGIPFGVVINRHGVGDDGVEQYCQNEAIPVLMKIPFDRDIAVLYSKGTPFVKQMPEWGSKFREMYRDICECVSSGVGV
ncbi:ATP-binding protein [Methanolobus profundi]|uniref:MinD superfamily P-loop ATPase, contains an inserted ferredoxin domain n=1 Tax=Methanolobus profundi TaxID=487685 RepID=A0A1I4QN92_9EURY|nr:ATP-binding protein [Methanolobus profundi]SFM41504.1 MinD superfamily P-loop ATPase, contains an inserted ferredoxin domain [Methanolobus profundi]